MKIIPHAAHTIALAGVGSPMNDDVWRSSRLNFARRYADRAGIRNAVYFKKFILSLLRVRLFIMPKTIKAGATPKVTTSAKESSSLPMGDCTFSNRATMPSKKSNTAPRNMNAAARSRFIFMACQVAKAPQVRLDNVIVFGMCFFIIVWVFVLVIKKKYMSIK